MKQIIALSQKNNKIVCSVPSYNFKTYWKTTTSKEFQF